MKEEQFCPICDTAVDYVPRYPAYVCSECEKWVSDRNGRPIRFGNETLLGTGIVAHYADTGERYPSDICFIDGIPCRAEEARFGGIVIQTVEK